MATNDNTGSTEARVILFSEWRKKVGDSYDVEHLTLRAVGSMTNEDVMSDFRFFETTFANMGYEHADAPKQSFYPKGGGAGGGKRPERKQPVDDGTGKAEFEVHHLTMFAFGEKKNVKAFAEDGTECVAWQGEALDKLMKTVDPRASTPFLNWAEWKADEQHEVGWTQHKLVAKCAKSAVKTDDSGKQTGGKWYIASFEVK